MNMGEIDNLASSHCDFCDYENSKPCLSCMKYIIFCAIKEAFKENLCMPDECSMNEAIAEGVSKCFGYLHTDEMKDATISGVSLAHGHVR